MTDFERGLELDRAHRRRTRLGIALLLRSPRPARLPRIREAQLRPCHGVGRIDGESGLEELDAAQIAQQLQALGLVPELMNAQYAGVSPALSALQAAASIPYTGVNNYAALVNGLTGKYGTETVDKTETSGGLANLLGSLSGLGSMMSGASSLMSGIKDFRDLGRPRQA